MSSKSHFFREKSRLNHNNVISLWSFENNYIDSIGLNNGSSPVPSFANGLIGRKTYVGETSSRVIIPNDVSLSFTENGSDAKRTITTLFDSSVYNSGTQYIACKRGIGANASIGNEWAIILASSGDLFFALYDNSGFDIIYVQVSGYSFVPFQSYHLTCTYDGSGLASGLKFFINGIDVSTNKVSVGNYVSSNNYSNDLVLGNNSWNPIDFNRFRGHLDEFKIWSLELSDDEILELATKELSGIKVI